MDILKERLWFLRAKHNKSQKDIACVLGTTQQQYLKYENGVQELPIRHLITLAQFFNVSSDYLLGLSPVKYNNTVAPLPTGEKGTK